MSDMRANKLIELFIKRVATATELPKPVKCKHRAVLTK